MDTDSDFIRPEFLNIIFFQQKNLVVFPYVDLKHLYGLEMFTVGYNVVDLESTALYNLKEIMQFEATDSYSQNPTFYFIYNIDRENLKELMNLDGIRCVINSNENIGDLVDGSNFIFFNKKNNQFLNYDVDESDLEFERQLISESEEGEILQENIQKIKIAASRIFKELNQTGSLEHLPDILSEYEKKYWSSILEFTSHYYHVNIPDTHDMKFKPQQISKDYSDEYELLISTNRQLGKEFIQLLHEYRSKKVNPAHLELEELYDPLKLYNYMRNHHWKDGIPEDFVQDWSRMNISNYQLSELDQFDFESIQKKLGIHQSLSSPSQIEQVPSKNKEGAIKETSEAIPSLENKWEKFKQWLLLHVDNLEHVVDKVLDSGPGALNNSLIFDLRSYLYEELSDMNHLLSAHNDHAREGFQKDSKKKGQLENNELLVVDVTNIINLDKDEGGTLKVEHILKVADAVKSLGYVPIMIADANMKYYPLDDLELYERLIQQGVITQAPAGRKADEYVLKVAQNENCKFLANDMYKDYWDEFGKEWIFKYRLACMFVNGKFIIR